MVLNYPDRAYDARGKYLSPTPKSCVFLCENKEFCASHPMPASVLSVRSCHIRHNRIPSHDMLHLIFGCVSERAVSWITDYIYLAFISAYIAYSIICVIGGIHNGLKVSRVLGMLHDTIITVMANCLQAHATEDLEESTTFVVDILPNVCLGYGHYSRLLSLSYLPYTGFHVFY